MTEAAAARIAELEDQVERQQRALRCAPVQPHAKSPNANAHVSTDTELVLTHTDDPRGMNSISFSIRRFNLCFQCARWHAVFVCRSYSQDLNRIR